jgi:aldose 1-epimerase
VSRGGDEHAIRHGDLTAVVTQVGGGLRVLRHGEHDLVRPYAADEVRPRYRGALLAPWPNRVVDGRYTFAGTTYQLDLSEPERGHALHGLVCWSRFEWLERGGSTAEVRHVIVPSTGYPFEVEVRARYVLADDGLTCTVTATNLGPDEAPFGNAAHPYLTVGPGPVDGWTLEVPAGRVLEVTPDRLVPTGLRDVEGTDLDFRGGRLIGDTEVDHAYTALVPGDDGLARVTVRGPEGRGARCTWDPVTLPWVQVHTADLRPPEPSRVALAVEAMTCPPDAFNSGLDLRVLAPGGGSTEASWTIGPA